MVIKKRCPACAQRANAPFMPSWIMSDEIHGLQAWRKTMRGMLVHHTNELPELSPNILLAPPRVGANSTPAFRQKQQGTYWKREGHCVIFHRLGSGAVHDFGEPLRHTAQHTMFNAGGLMHKHSQMQRLDVVWRSLALLSRL